MLTTPAGCDGSVATAADSAASAGDHQMEAEDTEAEAAAARREARMAHMQQQQEEEAEEKEGENWVEEPEPEPGRVLGWTLQQHRETAAAFAARRGACSRGIAGVLREGWL
jgi:hypothetical protein